MSGGAPDAYGELGIRHEHTVAVTEAGCENLAPKWSGTPEEPAVLLSWHGLLRLSVSSRFLAPRSAVGWGVNCRPVPEVPARYPLVLQLRGAEPFPKSQPTLSRRSKPL